jgi:hypothetical protein
MSYSYVATLLGRHESTLIFQVIDIFQVTYRTSVLFSSMFIYIYIYIGCPRGNVPNFGRVFLMLNYTDITQNTYIQS